MEPASGEKQPPTPTERALALPEILSHIFLCTLPNRDTTHAQTAGAQATQQQQQQQQQQRGLAALARCCRVSKLWHAEAAPRLWASPCSTRLNLYNILAHVAAGPRRVYHAGLVEEAGLRCTWGEERGRAEAVLEGLDFPRLRRVTVYLSDSWVRIPKLRGEFVTRLDLVPTAWREESDADYPSDREDEADRLDQGVVLDQIPEIFPNLDAVEFQDRCLASAEHLRRLQSRLPRLEYFNHGLVVEDLDDMWEAPHYTDLDSLPPFGIVAGMFEH